MYPSFFMTITEISSTQEPSARTRISGLVQFGTIADEVEISLHSLDNHTLETCVSETHENNNGHLSLIVPFIPNPEVYRYGFVVSPPNTIPRYSKFTGRVRFLSKDQGGRSKPLILGSGGYPTYEVILNIHGLTFLIMPCLVSGGSVDVYRSIDPGSTVDLYFDLSNRYIPLDKGYTFTLQEGASRVAEGAVITLP